MYFWLVIGIGGFIGAVLRYLIGGWMQNGFATFPIGTLGVNFIGSFFLGIIMYMSEYRGLFSEEIRIFLTIGILGAFTTMSAFSYESFRLFEKGELVFFAMNLIGTVFLTILAVYLGKLIVVSHWRI